MFMTINSTQPISLGGIIQAANSTSSIQGEFGGRSAISLSEYYRAGVYVPSGVISPSGTIPTAGAISMSLFRGATDSDTTPQVKPSGSVDLDLSAIVGSVFSHTLARQYIDTPTVGSHMPKLYFQFWNDGAWSTSVDSDQAGIVDGVNKFTETWGNWIEPNNYTYASQHWIRYTAVNEQGIGTYGSSGTGSYSGDIFNTWDYATIVPTHTKVQTDRLNNNAGKGWTAWLDYYAIWAGGAVYYRIFTVAVNFPTSGQYQFDYGWEGAGLIYIDGVLVISGNTNVSTAPASASIAVTAGTHSLKMEVTKVADQLIPGGMALRITGTSGSASGWVNGSLKPQCWVKLLDTDYGATYYVDWLAEMANNASGSPVIDSTTFRLLVGQNIKTYTVEYLIVAAGGTSRNGGGGGSAGTAGAGGVVLGICQSNILFPLASSNLYGVSANLFTIGQGRSLTNTAPQNASTYINADGIEIVPLGTDAGRSGLPSAIGAVVAFGGAGGIGGPSNGTTGRGGSGAGCGQVISSSGDIGGPSTQVSYPSYGGVGYGNAGGTATRGFEGTGGGGAGSKGKSYSGPPPGNAGDGLMCSITGTAVEYARGGCMPSQTSYVYLNQTWGGGGCARDYNASTRVEWRTQKGNQGIIIVVYPSEAGQLNIGGGLTYTLDTTSRPGYNVYSFTNGSDIVEFPIS